MRSKYIGILVIFSQLSYSLPQSPTVVGISELGNKKQFEAFLSSDPRYVSLAKQIFLGEPQSEKSDELFADFKVAQKLYFQSNRSIALEAYKKVLSHMNTADWKPAQRKILFTAAFRSAELSESLEQRSEFLTDALKISVKITPDKKIFSPPLIETFENLKTTNLFSVKIPKELKTAEVLSIAGQAVNPSKQSTIQFPSGEIKVFVYSSNWGSTTALLDRKNFSKWKPSIKNMLKGNCVESTVKGNHLNNVDYVFVNKNCVLPVRDSPALALSPAFSKTRPSQSIKSINFGKVSAPKVETDAWWKNKWLWMGVAGAGAAYIIYENNQNSGGRQAPPTTTYE